MIVYCNDYYNMIVIEGEINEECITKINKLFPEENQPIYCNSGVDNINYIILNINNYTVLQTASNIIYKNKGFQVLPVFYSDGWEIHQFVCFNKLGVSTILEELGKIYEVEIIFTVEEEYYNPLEFFGLSAGQLFNMLTPNQLELLLTVYKEGYYNIPREIKLNEIAESIGKSRHSVGRTLRKAERNIMQQVIPLVDLEFRKKSIS